jgi:succinate dehydrogenase / fumarate reductase cytochrome b subunit
MDKNKKRPRYLNLFKIKMPVTAVLSIAHRASGFLMVIAIPFAIYVFQRSVSSEKEFNSVIALLQHPLISLILIVVAWSFVHHFIAGIRFLLIDMDIGVDIKSARRTAWLTHIIAVTAAVCIAGVLL